MRNCSESFLFSVFCGTAAPAVVLREVTCRAGAARHNYDLQFFMLYTNLGSKS
jgi:hypothetical protein